MSPRPGSARTDTAEGDKLQALPPIDPQDPLPESNWRPRRWSSFVVCLVAGALLFIVIAALHDIAEDHDGAALSVVKALSHIAGLLVTVILFDRILLMVAPSAEQVIKMFQTAGLILRGVSIKSETKTRATASSAESTTTTTTEPPPVGRD